MLTICSSSTGLFPVLLASFGMTVWCMISPVHAATGPSTSSSSAPATQLGWQFEYDDNNRPTKIIDPAGRATQFAYGTEKNGTTESVTRTPPYGPPVVWNYDKAGRVAGMTDGIGKSEYNYDGRSRLERVSRQGSPAISYGYDTLDRVTDLRVGDFYHIHTTYDFLGRIEKVDTPAGAITYNYLTGQNMVERTLPNEVKTLWKYAANGELQKITHVARDNIILAEFTYSHWPDGRIESIGERSGQGELKRSFMYDKVGRLIQANGSDKKDYRYEYDLTGNRIKAATSDNPSLQNTFDWAGRLTGIGSDVCKSDSTGNLTDLTFAGKAWEYRFHADGRLAGARSGSQELTYRYDGDGRLVGRGSNKGETRFLLDPRSSIWQPLVIENKSAGRTLVIWDGQTPLALIHDGKTEYLLNDHLGSERLAVDSGGKVIRRMEYDPFGVPDKIIEGNSPMPLFAGLFWDPEAQLYLTLARAYIPHLGRFLQPDPQKRIPTASQETVSLFNYSRNDPVNWVDLDGRESFSVKDREWRNWAIWNRVEPEGGKREGTQTDLNNFLSDINGYIDEYKQNHLNLQTSEDINIVEARKYAFQQWSQHHHNDPLGRGDDFDSIKNCEISSNLGTINLDWLASLGQQKGWTSNIFAYAIGKEFWFARRQEAPDLHSFSSAYPRSNWNALKAAELFLSGKVSAEEVFLPNKVSPAVSKARRELDNFSAVLEKIPYIGPAYITHGGSGPSAIWLNAFSSDLRHHLFDTTRAKNTLAMFAQSHLANSRGSGIAAGLTATALELASGFIGGKPVNLAQQSSGFTKPWSPSPVGGVYLGGASRALDGIGSLRGIQVDSNNGNLVLVAGDGDKLKTPPLRIDDVVTVFRSVYLHGEGPTVTIDPASKDPEKSAMIIRHGKATEDTYAGWVLYQADRLMKTYTLGVDNITQKDMQSRVPGYKKVVDTIYFGGSDPEKRQKEGHWERFWIVPAESRRFEGTRRELTLLDVPLKVNTQSMKWENGALMDDLSGKSSPGAEAFTSWFASNYDAIAQEQYLTPPLESGLTEPVPVFAELRRIALLTAIAEKLRDQGVPLPYWMRDYEVKKVPFEKITPGMLVTRSNDKGGARIYGGVSLSPGSKEVKTFNQANLPGLPSTERADVDRTLKLADSLEKTVGTRMTSTSAPPLTTESISNGGEKFNAVAMPGSGTLALGPGRLTEKDMVVPLSDGRAIQLARGANSFFTPTGPWGKGWALDLPRLEEFKIPANRERSSVTFTSGYELVTPLNSLYARFKEIKPVAELQDAKLMVPDQEGLFYGLADAKPEYLKIPTKLLILKDGRRWHFTGHGDLVAREEGPLRTVYERDGKGQVTRVVAILAGKIDAEIRLEYDASNGLLKRVIGVPAVGQGKPEAVVDYQYDDSKRLIGVVAKEGTVGYRYSGPWVGAVTWLPAGKTSQPAEPKMLRSFEYNSQGQLVSEKQGDTATNLTIAKNPDGLHFTLADAVVPEKKEVIRFDPKMRPLERTTPEGVHSLWSYPEKGGIEMTMTAPGLEKMTVRESADGRRKTIEAAGGAKLVIDTDAAGRMVSLAEGENALIKRQWRPDGQPNRDTIETQAASYVYDQQSQLTSIIKHPPQENSNFKHWQETKLDLQGRPVAIKDYRGLDASLAYDSSGAVVSAMQKTSEGNFGYQIKRDETGRIQTVESSWGNSRYRYSEKGDLRQVVTSRSGRSATVDIEGGKVKHLADFDGGETVFTYIQKGQLAGLIQEVQSPNGLKLTYNYDAKANLAEVKVGEVCRVQVDHDDHGRVVRYAWLPAGI